MQCNDGRESPVRPVLPATGNSGGALKVKREREREREGGTGVVQRPLLSSKRTVCDHCRRRRIRCDGQFPCQQCANATLTCKREHVPKKRGPKRGHGRVINELRACEKVSREPESASNSDIENDTLSSAPRSAAPTAPTSPQAPFVPWAKTVTTDAHNVPEPNSPFSSEALRPNSLNYSHLVPLCVDLYFEHIYPIMPLLYMPKIRNKLQYPLTPPDKNLLYALCALTSFHMSGKSLSAPGPPSWEMVGRFFLDECISTRQNYDFLEDQSLSAVISSFWLSTSFFEINQNRKSWYYLREAMTLALDLGLHDDAKYVGLSAEETLCRQRVFWILFVTERSFAILRNKPLTLRKTPSLPTTRHDYEAPDIHAGFLKLVRSYVPLDESFVNAWNDGSDPRVSATTYLNLQQILAQPLDFLSRSRSRAPSVSMLGAVKVESEEAAEDPEPTAIQKADLLMTQQWLRLIVWQSSFRQGLLSTAAPDESMRFEFPLCIARDTASVLQSLPSSAVEVHGMGIFEKIFDIGTWCVNVLGAYDSGSASSSPPFGRATNGVAGMDFVSGEMGLLGPSGRSCASTDPLEFFVKMLSSSPNSRTMYAEKLLMFAGDTPGGMRTALSPALSSRASISSSGTEWSGGGTVVGEVSDEADLDEMASPLKMNAASSDQFITDHAMGGMVPVSGSGCMVHNPGMGARMDMHVGMGTRTGRSLGPNRSIIPDEPVSAGPLAFSDMGANGSNYGYGGALPEFYTGGAGSPPSGTFVGDIGMANDEFTDGKDRYGHHPQHGRLADGTLGVW